MEPVEISVSESHGIARQNCIVEQGVPVLPMSPEEARQLGIFDEGGRQVPASIHIEGTDHQGNVVWLLVALPVTMDPGERRKFYLKDSAAQGPESELEVSEISSSVGVANKFFALEFTDPGSIRLTTQDGAVLAGSVDLELRSDARSSVGNQRPVRFEPLGYKVVERTGSRVRILLSGRYRAWTPKSFTIDPWQRYGVEVEFVVYADSPVIRFRWRITNLMRFNCAYMWLDRYLLRLPTADGTAVIEGNASSDDGRFARWVTLRTDGATLSMTFPLYDWLGKGAGIEVGEHYVAQGGANPPPDGGFGGKVPDIYRKFYYGMSRTFEGALLVGATQEQILSELNPLCFVIPPDHYSACGELPENGSRVDFGPWRDAVDRAADHLLESQWKGTLWFGEWWRERTTTSN